MGILDRHNVNDVLVHMPLDHYISQVTVMCKIQNESDMLFCHFVAVMYKLMRIKIHQEDLRLTSDPIQNK